MSQAQTIEDRVRDFVLKQFPLARKNGLKPCERWLESGLIDSLGILDLVRFLEEEFKVQVTDEELLPDNFQSLDAVAAFVRTKQMNDGSSAL
jgi:acyl carrier protein